MKENLVYINHLNERFVFADEEAYVFENDLHDYSWDVIQKNNRIAGFMRGLTRKRLPIILHCRNEARGFELRNKLFEITEKDVIAEKAGRLELNGYCLNCYITASKKNDYLYHERHMAVGLTLTVEYPYWYKEAKRSYFESTGSPNGLDYPFDFPHDYTSGVQNNIISNPNFIPSNFRLIIYGDCANPAITIGSHTYRVDCTVATGEYLTIDSKRKKIYLTGTNGTVTNKFKDRDRSTYIFEPIPAGESVVSWNGNFGFDLTLIEERSEPKWI